MMSLKEERMQILKMLEEGKINVEEAANLLSALEAGASKEQRGADQAQSTGGKKARWLRIRVTDERSGKQRVNINLPIGAAGVAMRMGAKFAPNVNDVDMNELIEALESGVQGKIIDVQDEHDGEHVEIFVE